MRLATQLLRSLFALLLVIVAVAALLVGNPPAPRLEDLATLPATDCAPAAPAGLRGLARMPGDLGQLGRRIGCAG
jgi:hypothetical protein